MKTINFFSVSLLVIAAASLAGSASARAETGADLKAYLEDQIQVTQQAVDSESSDDACVLPAAEEAQEGWYFRSFLLRLRPRFGIDVIGFTKFQIQPEAELYFERAWPTGWTGFKPQK